MVETRTEQLGDVMVVELTGRLLLGTSLGYAENTLNRLIETGTRKVVIDITRLDHIDSSGLGMLIYSSGKMEQNGGQMRVAGAAGAVARVFDVAHADRVLKLDSSVAAACQHLADKSAAGQ